MCAHLEQLQGQDLHKRTFVYRCLAPSASHRALCFLSCEGFLRKFIVDRWGPLFLSTSDKKRKQHHRNNSIGDDGRDVVGGGGVSRGGVYNTDN